MKLFNGKKEGNKLDVSKGIPVSVYLGYDGKWWVYPEEILDNLKGYMETHKDFKDKFKELFE